MFACTARSPHLYVDAPWLGGLGLGDAEREHPVLERAIHLCPIQLPAQCEAAAVDDQRRDLGVDWFRACRYVETRLALHHQVKEQTAIIKDMAGARERKAAEKTE